MEETDRRIHDPWREAELRREGCEEWAEVSGLLVTQVHGAIQAWAATKAHSWVCGPVTAGVCADVCGSCYHGWSGGQSCPELVLPPTDCSTKGTVHDWAARQS